MQGNSEEIEKDITQHRKPFHERNQTAFGENVTKSIHFPELKPTPGLKAAKDTLGLGANIVGICK